MELVELATVPLELVESIELELALVLKLMSV